MANCTVCGKPSTGGLCDPCFLNDRQAELNRLLFKQAVAWAQDNNKSSKEAAAYLAGAREMASHLNLWTKRHLC